MTWREKAVAEALTWMRTPHRNGARVKGAGVDCAQILIAVYESAGVLEPGECKPDPYPADYALHRLEQSYLAWVEKYCDPVDGAAMPGDIAVFHYGRSVSHAGIVLEWPRIIHAYTGLGVIVSDVCEAILCDKKGVSRLKGIYRPRGFE